MNLRYWFFAVATAGQFAAFPALAQFTVITNGPVATDGGDSTGCAWGDYDNDGNLDLFVSNFGTPSNFLYRNNGDGSFTRATTGAITTDGRNSEGAAWADYDNDGFLDLFVAVGLGGNDLLYRNNAGAFTKITSGPVVQSGGNSRGCAWGDYDNDGFVDLFVANEQGQNNFLFRNNGDGAFTRITSGSVVNDGGASYGCAWGDYDNDGFLDLFVANLNQNNFLYHNNGDGTFARVTAGRIVLDGGASQGCAWGDYDNDGLLDLFVANRSQRNFLYHNEGNGAFAAITNGPMVSDVGYSWSAAWLDFDNDGFLDLFVVNGPPNGPGQNDFLYRNNGDGTFTKITSGSAVNDGAIGDGCAWGDYNNDGFVDLFVTNLNGQNNLLYRNNGNNHHWLTVRCVGRMSNRSGIGTKVRLKTLAEGQDRWQMREISGGSGYGSQNAPYAYFGLGGATNIEIVRVEWPSGLVQELRATAPNQLLTVLEPRVEVVPSALTLNAGETATFSLDTDLASPLSLQWLHDGMRVEGETNASLVITSMKASDAGNYSLEIKQASPPMTVFTKPARLVGPIVLQTNRQFISARPGSNATFQAAFTGAPPIQLQWRCRQQPIPGATNATLTLTNVQLADDGEYSVIASNSFGVMEGLVGALVVLVRPSITIQPVSQSVVAGGSSVLSVAATGNPLPLSYRWRRNGVVLTNIVLHDTNCFFMISDVQPNVGTNVIIYTVAVTNLAGTASLSSNTVITVVTDADGDGISDEWELANGLNPTNPSDAALDSDGDGVPNRDEHLAGTDPADAQSCLKVQSIALNGSPPNIAVRFPTYAGKTYTVQLRRNIESGVWISLADVAAASADREVEVHDATPLAQGETQKFYRVVTPRAPP